MRPTCTVWVRRFLVSAEAAEMPVAVVLNKADLVTREHCQQTQGRPNVRGRAGSHCSLSWILPASACIIQSVLEQSVP